MSSSVCRTEQAQAVKDRAQALISSGLADELISKKQAKRDAAWFEEVS